MEINSNKAGIARSTEENRAAAKAMQAKDVQSPQSASATKQAELKEGQQVKGQILDLRYNEVKIQLEPGKQIVTARLSGEVPLAIGEEANFIVTEDSANRLVLKYLPEDTAPTDSTILKALTASGLPLTDRNKAILSELLSHRMPIDRQTLQTLIKAAVTNRNASPQNLVLMLKNNIPLTASNIRQFEAYQNGSNKLLGDILNITKALPELLSQPGLSIESSTGVAQSVSMANNQTTAFLPNTPIVQADVPASAQNTFMTVDTIPNPGSPLGDVLSLNASLLRILLGNPESDDSKVQPLLKPDTSASAEATPLKVLSSMSNAEFLPSALSDTSTAAANTSTTLESLLTDSEQTELKQLLRQLMTDTPLSEKLTAGNASITDVFRAIAEALPLAGEEASRALLQSPEYAKLLTEAFHQKWTITPDKLAKKDAVPELYQKLQEDMEALSQLSNSEEKLLENLKLQEPVKNLQDNLQFMKDINQMFTYIQLPVQLKDQDIHSDLYVFTNKKALQNKKNLSVLLHLDMPNLGALNVHVTMEHNQVHARFYLEDKEAESLISDNVVSLSDALKKKGYSFSSEVSISYQKPDFISDFIEQNAEESSPIRYSFDIRA